MELEDSEGKRTTSQSPEIIIKTTDEIDVSFKPEYPKVRGVYFDKRHKKWRCRIQMKGNIVSLYYDEGLEGYRKAVAKRAELEELKNKIKVERWKKGLV